MLTGRNLAPHTDSRPGRAPTGEADGPILHPRVNHGAWIVDCPYCNSALAYREPDVWFFCLDCGNRRNGGLRLPIQWPTNLKAIEEALDRRPDYEAQNWTDGETVADLWRENGRNGID